MLDKVYVGYDNQGPVCVARDFEGCVRELLGFYEPVDAEGVKQPPTYAFRLEFIGGHPNQSAEYGDAIMEWAFEVRNAKILIRSHEISARQ